MKLTAIILLFAGLAAAQNTPVFPNRAATNGDMFVATNNFSTTLLTGITSSTATSATVASATGLTIPAMVTIDTEIFAVCRVTGNTLTFGKSSCPNADGRGYDGSVAVNHVAGRPVEARVVAGLHNQAAAEVIALEGAVGVGVSDLAYATLPAANAAASTAGRTLFVNKSWTAQSTQTINDATFLQGGKVQPAAGQVLSFSNFPRCPGLQQCFDVSLGGPGSILFPNNSITHTLGATSVGPISADWFGAKCAPITSTTIADGSGARNVLALTAAQRALPQWATTPDNRNLNVGKFTLGTCGVGYAGFPISGTVSLSPSVTFSGTDNTVTYMFVPPGTFSGGINGNYVFDTILEGGSGTTTNNNFDMGLKNLTIDTVTYNPSIINGVWWGASLRSSLSHLWINTRGTGIYVPGQDGGVWDALEVDLWNQACGETTAKAQGLVFANNPADTITDTINNLKFGFAAAYGVGGMDPALKCASSGYIYGARPVLEIGAVDGLIINGANFENTNYPVVVHASYNVRLNAFKTFLDCATSCTIDVPCAATVSSLAFGFHLDLSANHATRGICIGEAWQPNFSYNSSAGLITLIDPYGCVETFAGFGPLTSGATPPSWPGPSCMGATSDGALTWIAAGPVNIQCSPQLQNVAAYFYSNYGTQQNCYIPATVAGNLTSGQGAYQQKQSGLMGNPGPTVNGGYEYVYDSETFWTASSYQFVAVKGVNFNTTSDQPVYVSFPSGYNRFLIKSVTLSNSSVALTTARAGVNAGPAAAFGCQWVLGTQSWEVPSNANTPSYTVSVPVATNTTPGITAPCIGYGTSASGNTYNALTGYARGAGYFYIDVTIPQGVPATADMTFELEFLP